MFRSVASISMIENFVSSDSLFVLQSPKALLPSSDSSNTALESTKKNHSKAEKHRKHDSYAVFLNFLLYGVKNPQNKIIRLVSVIMLLAVIAFNIHKE